jgi:hypothetical protein
MVRTRRGRISRPRRRLVRAARSLSHQQRTGWLGSPGLVQGGGAPPASLAPRPVSRKEHKRGQIAHEHPLHDTGSALCVGNRNFGATNRRSVTVTYGSTGVARITMNGSQACLLEVASHPTPRLPVVGSQRGRQRVQKSVSIIENVMSWKAFAAPAPERRSEAGQACICVSGSGRNTSGHLGIARYSPTARTGVVAARMQYELRHDRTRVRTTCAVRSMGDRRGL